MQALQEHCPLQEFDEREEGEIMTQEIETHTVRGVTGVKEPE